MIIKWIHTPANRRTVYYEWTYTLNVTTIHSTTLTTTTSTETITTSTSNTTTTTVATITPIWTRRRSWCLRGSG